MYRQAKVVRAAEATAGRDIRQRRPSLRPSTGAIATALEEGKKPTFALSTGLKLAVIAADLSNRI
jgi:hypothetical protein